MLRMTLAGLVLVGLGTGIGPGQAVANGSSCGAYCGGAGPAHHSRPFYRSHGYYLTARRYPVYRPFLAPRRVTIYRHVTVPVYRLVTVPVYRRVTVPVYRPMPVYRPVPVPPPAFTPYLPAPSCDPTCGICG